MKTKQLFFVTIIILLLCLLQFLVLQFGSRFVFGQQPQMAHPFPSPTISNEEQVQNRLPTSTITPQALTPSINIPDQSHPSPLLPVVHQPAPPPPPQPEPKPAPKPEPKPTPKTKTPQPVTLKNLDKLREIYVPSDELSTIFSSAKDSLLIKRNEFEQLRKQAREVLLELDRNKIKNNSPVEAILISSDYKIDIADLRAVIEGKFEIEVLTDDIVAIPLQLDRVSVIEATDIQTKKPAALETHNNTPQQNQTNTTDKKLLLILQGKKKHEIKIVATTPLDIDSARQRIAFQLPYGTKNSLRLSIPGDVELKNGAAVISRKIEERAGENNSKLLTTQFELLPQPNNNNQTDITMSLNSHRVGTYQAIIARSIQFAEVTEQYERLHATVSLTEMRQGISEAIFDIPAGFEITDVVSVLLNKWNVEKGEKNKPDQLKLTFREQLSGLTTIYLSAIKINQLPQEKSVDWQFPVFHPVNAVANSAVLGLLVEQELEMTNLASDQLYPVDPLMLQDAIPPSALNTVPGSPLIRLASAWYAPRNQFLIKANFKRPKTDCNVETREVLILADKTPTLQIDYTITARTGKIFETIIEMPTNWKISSITTTEAEKKTLEFREANTNKTNNNKQQIIVQFPYGIIPSETFRFVLLATGKVDGWFTTDNEKKINYPQFNIIGTTNTQGKIGILYNGEEDWEIIPTIDENLIPLNDSTQKLNVFQPALAQNLLNQQVIDPNMHSALLSVKSLLAYEYLEKPFDLQLKLEKLQPRLNVKTATIYSFTPTLLHVNHELWFTIKHASTQRLSFLLPITTPNIPLIEKINDPHIAFAGNSFAGNSSNSIAPPINNHRQSEIKETFSNEVEIDGKKYRRWEILLSKPQAGLLKLNVSFDMPIEQDKNNNLIAPTPFNLPMIIAENVAWQSDIIAVQGDEELDLHVVTESTNTTNNAANNNKPNEQQLKSNNNISVLRSVDIGTIAEMGRQPDGRLIGVYSVLRDSGDVVVMMQRNQLLSLVTAVIENVTVIAQLGDSKRSGTIYSVLYDICTDGVSVKLTLKDNDEIWAVKLDGQTIKPQRVGNDLLIPIQQNQQPAQNKNNRLRRVELVYHSGNNPLGNIQLSFPSLRMKRSEGDVIIPVMQTRWGVIPPTGYNVTKIGDKVITSSDKFNPVIFDIFNIGIKTLNTLTYRESDWQQYFTWLPTFNFSNTWSSYVPYSARTRADQNVMPKASAPAEAEQASAFLDGLHIVDYSSAEVAETFDKEVETVAMADERHNSLEVRQKKLPTSNITPPTNTAKSEPPPSPASRLRRLKSVQPVTIVINHDLGSGTNYSLIGTKNIQEISVKLSKSSNRVIYGFVSYFVVLFIGLLFIRRDNIFKIRFVFFVFIFGTFFVFIPYFDSFTVIFNSSVYAILTVAIIFLSIATHAKIKQKLSHSRN
ncbi:MAG: hypothetical protein LBH59_02550 [Planctomycetaceae bacterium]|jgi:hypothetical protein|nr:hypothetical protein [Planctomycetaceae bacterium]